MMLMVIASMLGLIQAVTARQAPARTMMLRDVMSPDISPVDACQQMVTGLSLTRRDDGTIGLAEVPSELKRPFKLQFYTEFDDSDSAEFRDFISKDILPAATSLLARFIRVRRAPGRGARYERLGLMH